MYDSLENDTTRRTKKEVIESVKWLFENGVSFDVVCSSISILSDVELKNIYEQVKNRKI